MANTIPRPFIDDLLARVEIIDVLGRYLTLKKAGANYKCRCPFHDEKTASFNVNPTRQIYHCFGCGVGGNVISFLIDYVRLSFPEAIEFLANFVGVPIPRENRQTQYQPEAKNLFGILQIAENFYKKALREHSPSIQYLKNRGITGEIAKRFAIGYAPAGWDNLRRTFSKSISNKQLLEAGLLIQNDRGRQYDRFRDRIMFTIRNPRGQTIGFGGRILKDEPNQPKYLNSPETPVFHKSKTLYGLYEALTIQRQFDSLIIVEGYMDVIALAQAGIPNVVATLGTATTAEHIQLLARYTPRVIFCFDGDKAGRTAAWRALTTALKGVSDAVSLYFMFLPEGEDPDSLVREKGREKFLDLAEKAEPLSTFFINHLITAYPATTLEGRAQLLNAARPLLASMNARALRTLLLDRIAETLHLDLAEIRRLLGANQTQTPSPTNTTTTPAGRPPILRHVLAMLLQTPSLTPTDGELATRFDTLGQHYPILTALKAKIISQPEITAGQLLEQLRDRPSFQQLQQLALKPNTLAPGELISEFAAAIDKLAEQVLKKEINTLMLKAKTGEITDPERAQLQALLNQAQMS